MFLTKHLKQSSPHGELHTLTRIKGVPSPHSVHITPCHGGGITASQVLTHVMISLLSWSKMSWMDSMGAFKSLMSSVTPAIAVGSTVLR